MSRRTIEDVEIVLAGVLILKHLSARSRRHLYHFVRACNSGRHGVLEVTTSGELTFIASDDDK